MTWDEFLDWRAVYERDPWGECRDDLRSCVPMAMLAAVLTDSTPPDLTYPYFEDQAETAEDINAGLQVLEQHRRTYGWQR